MKKLLWLSAPLVLALGVMTGGMTGLAASAAPPPAPPGQGDCSHGNTGKACKPDPSTNGKDCEQHGNNGVGGVNEDHRRSNHDRRHNHDRRDNESDDVCHDDHQQDGNDRRHHANNRHVYTRRKLERSALSFYFEARAPEGARQAGREGRHGTCFNRAQCAWPTAFHWLFGLDPCAVRRGDVGSRPRCPAVDRVREENADRGGWSSRRESSARPAHTGRRRSPRGRQPRLARTTASPRTLTAV